VLKSRKKILFYRIRGYFGGYLIFAFFAACLYFKLLKSYPNKYIQLKKKTAIEWDYGILPPSSIKGLPTDKNV
jgi:hypothetical protein